MAEPDTAIEAPPEAPPAPGLVDDVVGLSRELRGLAQELRDLAHDQLQLVALETKLAAQSLMTMIAAAVAIGLLVVTAWLGLMGALVWWLAGAGVAPGFGMIAVAVLNLLAVSVPYLLIRRRSRSFGFPATLRSLRAGWSRTAGTGQSE